MSEKVKVLDKGFVGLVDVMGDDISVVQAARVSYGAGTKTAREDQGLIDYLMKNRHTSPFEMVTFKFHCKMPIFVARQWVRHRTASINEYSCRYSEAKDEFYEPTSDYIRAQGNKNKQGSSEELPDYITDKVKIKFAESADNNYGLYKEAIDHKVSRETARICLPVSLYTEWYWQINLHNLLHFLKLRMDHHAQREIRDYAMVIAKMVKDRCPMIWNAFDNYILNSVSLSRSDVTVLEDALKKAGVEVPDNIQRRLIVV